MQQFDLVLVTLDSSLSFEDLKIFELDIDFIIVNLPVIIFQAHQYSFLVSIDLCSQILDDIIVLFEFLKFGVKNSLLPNIVTHQVLNLHLILIVEQFNFFLQSFSLLGKSFEVLSSLLFDLSRNFHLKLMRFLDVHDLLFGSLQVFL